MLSISSFFISQTPPLSFVEKESLGKKGFIIGSIAGLALNIFLLKKCGPFKLREIHYVLGIGSTNLLTTSITGTLLDTSLHSIKNLFAKK